MMGITTDGFERETASEIVDSIKATLRGGVSDKLVLDETTPMGNLVTVVGDRIGQAWEALEIAYHAFDPNNAIGESVVALSELTGTERKTATHGSVVCTCTFSGSTTFTAGQLVAHVDGAASNRWRNTNPVTATAGTQSVAFESETLGSTQLALAGTLTKIAEPIGYWSAVTNPADATPGQDLESIEALRVRRKSELRATGSSTLGAIEAAVSAVSGVTETFAEENVTSATDANGVPPGGFQITFYDGPGLAASDVAIATAIATKRAAGAMSYGNDSETVNVNGRLFREYFRRATGVPLTVACSVTADPPVAIADVKQAIIDRLAATIGGSIQYLRLASAPFEVDGVTDVPSFTINGGTATIAISRYEIATLASGSITVTGDVV